MNKHEFFEKIVAKNQLLVKTGQQTIYEASKVDMCQICKLRAATHTITADVVLDGSWVIYDAVFHSCTQCYELRILPNKTIKKSEPIGDPNGK